MVRQNYSNYSLRIPPTTQSGPHQPTFSKRLIKAVKEPKKSLRNGNTRNPKEPVGVTSSMKYEKINRNDGFRPTESEHEDFYTSLRQDVVQTSPNIKLSPRGRPPSRAEYASLVNMADDARETKNALQDWKEKIEYLEANLKDQSHAMQVVLKQNEELESKVAKFARKEKMDQLSLGIPGAPSMHQLVEENKALEMEIKRLQLHQTGHVAGSAADQLAIAERNRLLRKEKQLEESLSIAKEKNEKLLEELNSKSIESSGRANTEGQALLERNQLRRKEAQLETSLAAAQNENKALLEEIRRNSLEFEKIERLRAQQEEEIKSLHSDLEMNRRIVHTKRSLIRKEMTDESMEQMKNDMEEQLTIELTTRITEELETRFKDEKEMEMRELRKVDEEKVRTVECQVPILENEIDRLRKLLSDTKQTHDREIATIEARYQTKLELMIENFSEERKREGLDFHKRIETLSSEVEQTKERAATDKEAYGSKIREEAKNEMQKEVQFLAVRVAELTTELIEVYEEIKEQKESFGDQLAKEKEEVLAKAADEHKLHVEKIRQEVTEEQGKEITKIRNELENVILEKESLLKTIESHTAEKEKSNEMLKEVEECLEERENERSTLQERLEEVEEDLRLTKESYSKDTEEFEKSRLKLESSKVEMNKLRNQREELIIMAEEFKNDCINMSNEMKKIKSHFKFAVLVEYEEKIIELENELQRLENVVAESKAFITEDAMKISNQSLLLEKYKAKEQELESEVKRLRESLMASVSDLESKEARLTELKEIIQKKEMEAFKFHESAKDFQRKLTDSERELAQVRIEQEITNQKIISTAVYREKISALNKELTKQKSILEHCRCERNDTGDRGKQNETKLLQERIQRLNVMLRAAEKNQQKEKLSFESTKNQLEKNLLAAKDEIKGLHLEVSRLKKLSEHSQKSLGREGQQAQFAQDGKTPRMKNNQQNIERMQQNQTLHDIESDFERYRSESERTIKMLRHELSLRNEENVKVAQELQDSQILFREAVMSWRVETRTLKTQLDHARYPVLRDSLHDQVVSQSISDGDSELSEDSTVPKAHELEIVKEQNNTDEKEMESEEENNSIPSSFEISKIETDVLQNDDSRGQQTPNMCEDSEIRDDVEESSHHSTMNPTQDDTETEMRDVESGPQGSKEGNETFTKMLDISEHSTSIEMRFDHQPVDDQAREELSEGELSEGERLERENAEAIYKSLQDFKKEYKKYVGDDNYSSIVANSFNRRKNPSVLGAGNKISKLSHAPQPHLNSISNDEKDRSNLNRSVSNSRSRHMISEVKKRGNHSFEQGKSHFLSQQNRLLSAEIDESSSKDASEKTSVSDRSRELRKKMSDLLQIKNNIKLRTNAQEVTDTLQKGEVTKQKQIRKETQVKTTKNARSGAPWGLAAEDHPKLYKFLKSKSSSETLQRGNAGLSAAPTDEHDLGRKNSTKPFDESSKHSLREAETAASLNNDAVPAHE